MLEESISKTLGDTNIGKNSQRRASIAQEINPENGPIKTQMEKVIHNESLFSHEEK